MRSSRPRRSRLAVPHRSSSSHGTRGRAARPSPSESALRSVTPCPSTFTSLRLHTNAPRVCTQTRPPAHANAREFHHRMAATYERAVHVVRGHRTSARRTQGQPATPPSSVPTPHMHAPARISSIHTAMNARISWRSQAARHAEPHGGVVALDRLSLRIGAWGGCRSLRCAGPTQCASLGC